jgi:hypothetical protein
MGLAALMTATVAAAPEAANAQVYTPKGPIEAKYIEAGPWAITTTRTTEPCDRKGNVCTIFHPADLGTNPITGITSGFKHPVIAWANGTGVPTADYALILRHWASWGFIVVASDDTTTGLGESTTDAATYMVALGINAASPFQGKVDGNHIGVSGHSQGGLTAIHLFAKRPDLFKASIPYNATTIGLGLVFGAANALDLTQVKSGSIFFMGGATDPLGNSVFQLTDYLATANAAGKALGSLASAGHDSLVKVPTCTSPDCVAARGYATAWMMWKLQNAADGPAAFAAGSGEFTRSHPQWLFAMSNGK